MEKPFDILATKPVHPILKEDLREEFDNLRKEIRGLVPEIRKAQKDLIGWMLVFWVAQVLATYGIFWFFLGK